MPTVLLIATVSLAAVLLAACGGVPCWAAIALFTIGAVTVFALLIIWRS